MNQIVLVLPLGGNDFKIIHLIRKNLLSLTLSNVINNHNDRYGRPAHIFKSSNLKDIGFSGAQVGIVVLGLQ